MSPTRKVEIHHLTRVEGHGNIAIRIRDGKLEEARWEVVETPRFFEAILVGKKWENAPWLCGRICGICSIGHTLASIRATERAFGIGVPPAVEKFRLLLKHMETLQSHILHLCFLVIPDFLGTGSVLPLIDSQPETVKLAARLKNLANRACDLIGGRRLHPTRTVVGGFTMYPARGELASLQAELVAARVDLAALVELFAGFAVPDFSRETEFVSLKGDERYPFLGGALISSDGVARGEDDYLAMTNEYCVAQSTSKWSRLSRPSFAVGALARLTNNFPLLAPAARAVAWRFGLAPGNCNPFMNNVAQLVECVQVVEDSIVLSEELLATTWAEARQPVVPRAGRGVAAVEVPRGILYHCYEFDGEGRITKADCVIPTSQNHANIQHDLAALVEEMAAAGRSDAEIEHLAAMLVRAYDPCISCSVH
ncbi:MAG TPA: Ni/Fe hydrogenase subunit alpha [Desulfurivibrionaceae bacterium]|nr:Ni/Fe hydrogenase subunit alpha [Desulfurivibrionaceae bacterium]